MSIILYPNPMLRKKCSPVITFDEDLINILKSMDKEVVEAHGEALAANQIGLDLHMFVVSPNYEDSTVPHWIINPEIINPQGNVRCSEGCLSLPGIKAYRNRYETLTLKYQNEIGEQKSLDVSGFFAIVIQHEVEHLNGKLFIDELSSFEANKISQKINKMRKRR